MRVKEFKIKFDREEFLSGETLNGKIVVRTEDPKLIDDAKVFLKFYDKLNIEWDEHQVHTIYTRVFSTLKKPFQLNFEEFFDKSNASVITVVDHEKDHGELEYSYSFAFRLPNFLQGTIKLPNASCTYFLKAYMTDDVNVSLHYQKGVNVFEEFFKSLNHTYCKEEIKISNKLMIPSSITHQVQKYHAQSSNYRINITLPQMIYFSNEVIPVHIDIEHANLNDDKDTLKLHKISFKLFQYCKVYAEKPYRKSNLFYYLIVQKSRKHIEATYDNEHKKYKISLDEELLIPQNLLSTTSKRFNENIDVNYYDDPADENLLVNGIRINYKLGLEFWKNFLIEDSEINMPVMINPEI